MRYFFVRFRTTGRAGGGGGESGFEALLCAAVLRASA